LHAPSPSHRVLSPRTSSPRASSSCKGSSCTTSPRPLPRRSVLPAIAGFFAALAILIAPLPCRG